MHEIVFSSKLTPEGNLYCPKEYSFKDAEYKVIVALNDKTDPDSDIELSAAADVEDDYLSNDEVNYYLALK